LSVGARDISPLADRCRDVVAQAQAINAENNSSSFGFAQSG